MFDLNFISNPGIQNENSEVAWSFLGVKNDLELNKEPEISYNDPPVIKNNSRKYFIYLMISIIIPVIIVIKLSNTNIKTGVVLNNIINILVESENNNLLQFVETTFAGKQAMVVIRSTDIQVIQSLSEGYYLQDDIQYELYRTGNYNYLNLIFPWKVNKKRGDIHTLHSMIRDTRFSNLIITQNIENILELEGKYSEVISFLLYIAENNQIQNFHFSILLNEFNRFKLSVHSTT